MGIFFILQILSQLYIKSSGFSKREKRWQDHQRKGFFATIFIMSESRLHLNALPIWQSFPRVNSLEVRKRLGQIVHEGYLVFLKSPTVPGLPSHFIIQFQDCVEKRPSMLFKPRLPLEALIRAARRREVTGGSLNSSSIDRGNVLMLQDLQGA